MSTDTNCPVREGDVLAGKYRVEKVIGIGGMGVVVAAQHIQLSQQVAVKFLLPSACESPEAVGRFIREARAAVRIQSEHVARVTDVGTLDDTGAPYMVMEFLKGEDLSSVLQNRGKLSVSDAVNYLLQACEAIAEAHAAGIIHRDLKPANLFLTKRADGTDLVKVLDFGISKSSILDASGPLAQSLTSTGTAMGSPLYMSPEQMRDSKNVDVRADIWALGAILFELVAGRNVYRADTLPALVSMIISDPAEKLKIVCPDIPEGFSCVVDKCLQKNPADRFSTVGDLALALLPYAPQAARLSVERVVGVLRTRSSLPSSVPTATNPQTATAPPWGTTLKQAQKKSRIALAGLALALGVLIIGGAVFGVVRSRTAAVTKTIPINDATPVVSVPKEKQALGLPPSSTILSEVPSALPANSNVASAPVQTQVAKPAPAGKDRPAPKNSSEKTSKTPAAAPAVTPDPLADP